MTKILGTSKQKEFEKELKQEWNSKSKLRGQLTFASGGITSKKLESFGFTFE